MDTAQIDANSEPDPPAVIASSFTTDQVRPGAAYVTTTNPLLTVSPGNSPGLNDADMKVLIISIATLAGIAALSSFVGLVIGIVVCCSQMGFRNRVNRQEQQDVPKTIYSVSRCGSKGTLPDLPRDAWIRSDTSQYTGGNGYNRI
ncbi:hypothetical protein F4778DRAFT_783845 [Xylariomycetidae sp. FL2044]|nr:hypothetical protein F4778DRAFT_783845 [Xylariomycetidae sp. FL2044]